jgi:hypothetical protein
LELLYSEGGKYVQCYRMVLKKDAKQLASEHRQFAFVNCLTCPGVFRNA